MIDFKQTKKRGFTLIEVMFSTAILTLVLSSFLYTLTQCTQMIEIARLQDIALNAAQEKIEEISSSDLTQAIANYHGRTFLVQDTSGRELLAGPSAQVQPLSVEVAETAGTDNLYEVKINLSWQQPGGRISSRQLSTTLAGE